MLNSNPRRENIWRQSSCVCIRGYVSHGDARLCLPCLFVSFKYSPLPSARPPHPLLKHQSPPLPTFLTYRYEPTIVLKAMIPDLSSATSPDAPPTASEDAAPPPKAIVLVIKKKRRSGQGKRPRGILLATQNARRRAKQISAATRRASTIAASSAQATGSTVAQAPLRTVMLPRRLARPVYRNVEEAAILAIEPELAGTSLQYIREKLQAVGSRCVWLGHWIGDLC